MEYNITASTTKEVGQVRATVESNSNVLDKIVADITEPYSKDLDKYVRFVAKVLADGNNPPTDEELDDFCLNLSTQIYFASGMCEQLGIRDDVAKAVYREMYNTQRASQTSGTVADKDSIAELRSQQELITSVCYTRAYKILKAKVESAQELLSSCKKVLSRRMAELELTKIARTK